MNRMDIKEYPSLDRKAMGREKAELVFKNGRIVNVFSEEILSVDIAVEQGVVVDVGGSTRGMRR